MNALAHLRMDFTLHPAGVFPDKTRPAAVAAAQGVARFVGPLLITVLAGCAVGPNYHRPTALGTNAWPAAFGDSALSGTREWKTAEPEAPPLRGAWWEIYRDPELSRLERRTASNNQQIAQALANYEEARAATRSARADFFPQVNGVPSVTRQRGSQNTSPGNAGAGGRTFNLFKVSADASWELDLWGRIRRELEAGQARAGASADDLAAAQLAVQAELAIDYFTLRALEAQRALLAQTEAAYRRALDLTQSRRQNGVATELDVAQAETQWRSVQAQIPAVDLQQAQTRHAIAVLCGAPATSFALTPGGVGATNMPAVPLSVPSEWLESRPDVAGAERRMAAANAEVGIAQAAFYPRVLLNASGGFESIHSSTMFDWPSRLWAVGPALQWPVFTGGRTRAQVAAARARYDGAVASYRQAVLTAFQDVEDQLAAQHLLATQTAREQDALTAAQRALEISNNRYKAGIEQYLDVITAQTAALAHEQTVIQLGGRRLAASVGLIKALGGGWKHEQVEAAKAARPAPQPQNPD